MRSLVVLAFLVGACDKSDKPTVPSHPGSGSSGVAPKTGSAAPTLTDRSESEPCNEAHDCMLRDNCGCSCDAVVLSAAKHVACEETCGRDACVGYTVICDLAMHRCGAIPKAPP